MMKKMHSDFTEMVAASTSMLSPQELDSFEAALSAVAEEVTARTGK